MRFREQDGWPTPLGFVVWLLCLAALARTGLLGPGVDGEPVLPRPFGVGITLFLLCCWAAAVIATLRTRRSRTR